MPTWQALKMPEAMDINGPISHFVDIIVPVHHKFSVVEILKTLEDELAKTSKHCHTPYFDAVPELNEREASGCDIMGEALRRQVFS